MRVGRIALVCWAVLPCGAVLLCSAGGCASEPPRPAEAPVVGHEAAPEGSDAVPRREVAGHDAIASAPLGDALLWVDVDRALHLDDGTVDRVIAREVGGAPVSDGAIAVWSEPMAPSGAEIRAMRAGAQPITIARASGATAPLAIVGPRVALVGSENGGVAGLWLAELGGGGLTCVTNCALRAGRPWGDAYVPPPGDGASIAIEGDLVTFVDATGTPRTARVAPTIGAPR